MEARRLVEGLFAALTRGGEPGEVLIERSLWSGVVEHSPQRTGFREYRGEGFRLRVGRVGGVYGYLEAELGDCRTEGVVVYGQARFVYRPSRVEASSDGCGSEQPGVSRG